MTNATNTLSSHRGLKIMRRSRLMRDMSHLPIPSAVEQARPRTRGPLRWLLLGIGWMSLALGMIGIIVPLLPTAPFLLLALACFSRSSPVTAEYIYRLPLAGKYLRDWQEEGISPGMKWSALAALWVTALLTVTTVAKTVLLKSLVLIVTLFSSLHFLLMPVRGRKKAQAATSEQAARRN